MATRKKLKKLRGGNPYQRRLAIFAASRSGKAAYVPQLLDRLNKEPLLENRRHIVLALGNIGGEQAAAALLDLLSRERGIILGDVATALGRMRWSGAEEQLQKLSACKIHWVSQQAAYALRRIRQERA